MVLYPCGAGELGSRGTFSRRASLEEVGSGTRGSGKGQRLDPIRASFGFSRAPRRRAREVRGVVMIRAGTRRGGA